MSERLNEIRERRAVISPSPWQRMGPTDNEERRGELRQYVTRTVGCGDVPPEKFVITILNCGNNVQRDVADAEFIANAPTDIDFLLTEVDRMRAALTVIACYDDERAEQRFQKSGLYSSFDEPASVVIARGALGDIPSRLPALTAQPEEGEE